MSEIGRVLRGKDNSTLSTDPVSGRVNLREFSQYPPAVRRSNAHKHPAVRYILNVVLSRSLVEPVIVDKAADAEQHA
jgi:hypothetical protein